METYKGLDYGHGQANIDVDTGIHYGVLSQHSVTPYFFDDIEYDYGLPTCPECGTIVTEDDLPDDCEEEYYCENCEKGLSSDDIWTGCEEPIGWHFKDGDYTLTDCLDSDIFVLKSPYYTYAQYCSPCVPGAGNLDTPCEDGPKTYCLGHDFFDGDCAPYPVFSVETGKRV